MLRKIKSVAGEKSKRKKIKKTKKKPTKNKTRDIIQLKSIINNNRLKKRNKV